MYTATERRAMQRTAVANPAWAKRAIVPQIVAALAPPKSRILDFGAGKYQHHTRWLRRKGFLVTPYDLEDGPLTRRFPWIMLSNVLNVQPSLSHIRSVLELTARLVEPNGKLVCNYPETPRKCNASLDCVTAVVRAWFPHSVELRPGLWVCQP